MKSGMKGLSYANLQELTESLYPLPSNFDLYSAAHRSHPSFFLQEPLCFSVSLLGQNQRAR